MCAEEENTCSCEALTSAFFRKNSGVAAIGPIHDRPSGPGFTKESTGVKLCSTEVTHTRERFDDDSSSSASEDSDGDEAESSDDDDDDELQRFGVAVGRLVIGVGLVARIVVFAPPGEVSKVASTKSLE